MLRVDLLIQVGAAGAAADDQQYVVLGAVLRVGERGGVRKGGAHGLIGRPAVEARVAAAAEFDSAAQHSAFSLLWHGILQT